LIVAVLIFGLGGGVSFFEGVQHMRHPEPMRDPPWKYAVLAAAELFEGISFSIALRQFLKQAGSTPFCEAVHRRKDPMLAEDAAALAGLAIAAVGIALSHRLNMPALDGAASVPIGLLLAGAAALLTWESRGLLIGEGVRPETAQAIRNLALAQSSVRDVGRELSMCVGPDGVLVTVDLDFDTGTDADEAGAAPSNIERQVRERFPKIRRLFIESGSGPVQQRWSRPDAVRAPVETPAAPEPAAPPPASPRVPARSSKQTWLHPKRALPQAVAPNELASIHLCVTPYRRRYTRVGLSRLQSGADTRLHSTSLKRTPSTCLPIPSSNSNCGPS